VSEWITQSQAARLLNISKTRVRQLIEQNKLEARPNANGRLVVSRTSVLDRLSQMQASLDPLPVPSRSLDALLDAVKAFHERHQFVVGTGQRSDFLLRLAMLQEELGELSSIVTKSDRGPNHGFSAVDWWHLQEEWADVLYLLLGWAVESGWTANDVAAIFERVHAKNMNRKPRHTALMASDEETPVQK